MIRPLTRDYWPDTTRRAFARAALAFVLAPLPVIAMFLMLAFGVSVLQSGDATAALLQVRKFGPVVAVGCYVLLLTGGLLLFLLLWALRRRGALDYTLAGLALGIAAAALTPYLTGGWAPSAPIYVVFALVCALMMLCLRAFAGVRRL